MDWILTVSGWPDKPEERIGKVQEQMEAWHTRIDELEKLACEHINKLARLESRSFGANDRLDKLETQPQKEDDKALIERAREILDNKTFWRGCAFAYDVFSKVTNLAMNSIEKKTE